MLQARLHLIQLVLLEAQSKYTHFAITKPLCSMTLIQTYDIILIQRVVNTISICISHKPYV